MTEPPTNRDREYGSSYALGGAAGVLCSILVGTLAWLAVIEVVRCAWP